MSPWSAWFNFWHGSKDGWTRTFSSSKKKTLVVFTCRTKKSRFVWVGVRIRWRCMLSHATCWGILSLCTIMFQWMTWMTRNWSMQSLGRWVWTITQVFRIATFCKGPSMGLFLYEEALGRHSPQHFISHVQEWPILLESNISDSIALCRYGC